MERDKYRCQTCGKAGRLEMDHKRPCFRGGAWWDTSNLQMLCRDCHFTKSRTEMRRPHHEARPQDSPERAEWRALVGY